MTQAGGVSHKQRRDPLLFCPARRASPFDPSMDSGSRAVSRDTFTVLSSVEGRDTNDEKRGTRKMLTGAGQKQPRSFS
jgi:hypothetical protein